MAGIICSFCNRFCCFPSSASDDEGQDHPASAGPGSSPSAIDNTTETLPGPIVVTPRKDEIEHHVHPNLDVSGTHQCDKAPLSESQNTLRKSEGENVNAHPNVSGATQRDEPSSSGSPNLPVIPEAEHVDVNPNVPEAPSPSYSIGARKAFLIRKIKHIGQADDGKKVDVNLDQLVDHISELLKLREEEMLQNKKASNHSNFPWPEGLKKKLKDILSFGTDLKNLTELPEKGLDFASTLKDDISGPVTTILKDIGKASVVTAGLLVVAYTLERFQDLSDNKDGCWVLIKEMSRLASVVKELNESPKGTFNVIGEATTLVVEGAITCCTQLSHSGWKRFLLASKDKADLSGITDRLRFMYSNIDAYIGIRSLSAIERVLAAIAEESMRNSTNTQRVLAAIAEESKRTSTNTERALAAIESKRNPPLSRIYPEQAVGIEESIEEVLSLLECESAQNAVTVILHGFGGMGKTTLADAVVSKDTVVSKLVGFKYSKVRMCEGSVIVDLQKEILEDLMEPGDTISKIKTHQDGQRELRKRLEQVQAFIYIDDALDRDALKKLLPVDMTTAQKVRLLLTTRIEYVKNACPRPKIYQMQEIQPQAALTILKREIKDGISDSQFNDIIYTCGGIPLMLTLTAGFIGLAENKKEAYDTLMLQKNKWMSEDYKEMRYAFAYDALPHDCIEPFLDICSYFKGWDWEAVEDIVGKDELKMLESRALVTRATNDVASVHDVILTLARQKSKENSEGKEVRLAFTSASKLTQFLEEEGAEGIKGIWLSDNRDALQISAATLDLMSKSLRVLRLGDLANVEGECRETFKELIYFEAKVWQLPFHDVSKLEKLRYLSYKPKHELKLSKMPSSLRHMEFDGTSLSTFKIYSNDLQKLEHLRILRLLNFSYLKTLPERLGDQLKGLHELSLSNCGSITKLPDSISELQSLRILKMDSCSSLIELPVDFGSLSSLRELHLDRCCRLKALPDSAEKLSSLTLLNLSGSSSLLNLPPCVGNLTCLVELNLDGCRELKSIPEGIGNLTRLVELNLKDCRALKSIPEGIGELKLLRALGVSGCSTLTELPDGLCNLSFITYLSFEGCWSLEKLPDRFGQLPSLKVLLFGLCHRLQKLPESFGQLKNLEVLHLRDCYGIRELCNDFHCLSSLQRLDLSGCRELEGKSMDHVVKMNRLQIVHIEGSKQLVDRWAEIQRDGGGSWSFTVISGQDLSISRVEKENIEKSLLLELDGLLTNRRGEQFHLSHLPPNTLILVTWYLGQWSIIEEMIDEMQMRVIYIGPDFDEFSTKVKDNIFVVDVPTARATQMRDKVHLTLDLAPGSGHEYLQIDTRMQVGDEYRPLWRFLSRDELEEFVVSNCKRYLRLKELEAERDEKSSNIELLTELFVPDGNETTPVFQKNESSVQQDPTANSQVKATCGVDKLKGKTILLEMRRPDSFYDIRLPSLKEMYLLEKERLNFEIISIPLLGQFEVSSNVFDVYKQFSREVPWLVLQNPWTTITREVHYFLDKQCTEWEEDNEDNVCEKWYPSVNWIIDPNGRITIYRAPISPGDMRDRGEVFKVFFNYLESESYQVRWGVNAPLTTLGKIEEVRKNEWQQLKNMSTLEFLFNHLESVSVQVKSLKLQGKFICFYSGANADLLTSFMRSAIEQFRGGIHFIHFSHEQRSFPLGNTLKYYYEPLENTSEMEGTSLLNLSRHETVRFIMRLRHLEEEMNGMDQSDEQLCELKTILHSLLFNPGEYGSFTFFDKVGKMVGALNGKVVYSNFHQSDRGDKLQRLINSMLKEGGKEMHDEDSSLIRKMQTASASAVEQQNADVYFDALTHYISELWVVELYQLCKLNKEGKKRSPPRVTWPTSRGLCRLKNFLSEGQNEYWVVEDVISRHSEEDAPAVVKSLVKDIRMAEWAVAGLLAVADLLERLETVPSDSFGDVPYNQIGCLFVLEEMFRLVQYCKQFNQKAELWRRMKCGAIVVILRYSIMCCWAIDPSKFPFRRLGDPLDMHWRLLGAEKDLRKECDTLAQTMTEDLVDESGSLAHLKCYKWGFDLWPDGEGGPSSEYKRSASFPDLWLKNEVEGGPSSEYKRSASFPTWPRMTEGLDNESGSVANLHCYKWGFDLWPEGEGEGGPSSE